MPQEASMSAATRRGDDVIPVAESLAHRYQAVRDRSRRLCHGLSREDCVVQSMPDASPVKWHLAHTSWFFETFLLTPRLPGYRPWDPAFRYLYNSYYDGVGPQFPRPQRGMVTRPSLEEVWLYRAGVDTAMRQWLQTLPDDASGAADAAPVELGLAHEEQHQELILTDVKSLLALNPLKPSLRAAPQPPSADAARPVPAWSVGNDVARPVPMRPPGPAPSAGWSRFDAQIVRIGQPAGAATGFRFDNETPQHRVFVESFELADAPVTNGDYRRFIEDDGYRRPGLWLSEGFQAAQSQGWRAPLYWTGRDGDWFEYTLHGERLLDAEAPVCHLSLYEADAYARWAGARLPTEFEWERAAAGIAPRGQFAEVDGWLHPRAPAPGRLAGLFGGVWEWTSSSYGPYPGFAPRDDAIGEYNGKFMVNQYVLRGGSCATPPGHVRATYRNFFPAWARWQFSGVRLARSV
jgi:ergothioneine biosynthesis protein EgtB